MRRYDFVLVNVFAESHFGGNPLAVFPNARGLSEPEMQALARQFNLSETVFAFPGSNGAAADVRIFTPDSELPLAGHPVLGCAFVLQRQQALPANFVLNTRAKPVYLHGEQGMMTFSISGHTLTASSANQAMVAAATGLDETQLVEAAYWLNSGSPQLLQQVQNPAALQSARVDYSRLHDICQADGQRTVLYLWCEEGDTVYARLFFAQDGALLEDCGTGSACANLGAYFIECGRAPLLRTIHQGDHMHRPNRLHLRLDEAHTIFVGGQVIEVGSGVFDLPEAV